MPRLNPSNFIVWLPLVMFLVLVDQLCKAWVISELNTQDFFELIPGVFLGHTQNTGIAFSMFANLGSYAASAITCFAAIINLALIAVLSIQQRTPDNLSYQLSLTTLISGGLSNLIDRLYYGAVIDYIYLNYHGWQWPTIFNIADVCVCLGCIGILISGIRLKDKSEEAVLSVNT